MSKPARWFLYVLRCADGSLYTGITNDLSGRLEAHRHGRGSKYVRSRLPAKMVYREPMKNRSGALKREAEIKSWTRPQKLVLILKRKPRRDS